MELTKYETITRPFFDNWLTASIILLIFVVAFLPRLRDGIKLTLEWCKKIHQKLFPKIKKPHYTPCSQWMLSIGDRVRNIDENLYRQNGTLIILNLKGGYAICYIGDPYNGPINTFNINELTKEGI